MKDSTEKKPSYLSKYIHFIKLQIRRSILFVKSLFPKTSIQEESDKKLVLSLSKSKLPNFRQLKYVGQFLGQKEKRIIAISSLIILVSLIFLGIRFYTSYVKIAPKNGGSYIEGIVGTPKLINPIYASINNADIDISYLIYSGLLKRNKDNSLTPDLAEKFEISSDEKIYTLYLKKEVEWHDGASFNADDVIFTFQTITNAEYKSPLQISFEGVRVEKIDDYTIKFILNEPYAAFLELLTVGILPQKLWSQIPPSAANLAELNLRPIGAGPYKPVSLTKDKSGNIKSYELEKNDKYHGKKPYLNKITFKFFNNFQEALDALNREEVEGLDFLPKEYEKDVTSINRYNYYNLNQPQLTALFFNQSNLGALADKKVRQALAHAINKQEIVATTSLKYFHSIESPILLMFTDYYNQEIRKYEYDLEKAKELLDQAGWKVIEVKESETDTKEEGKAEAIEPGVWRIKGDEYLTLTITTVNQLDNIIVAELIKEFWERLNIKVNIEIISADLIQNEVIRPRNYQILLYGEILGADPDQYPFWHSSQIGSGGLNLTNYNNKKTDELLEDARITNNIETRIEKYKKFQEIITEDLPAIFLFSRTYNYLQDKKIKGFEMTSVIIPSDRFNNISDWYIKTGRKIVW